MTEIENLLIKLIKIPSVSGDEKGIADFIVKQLNDFEIKKQFIDKNRYNIIAKKGNSKKWLVAHMDTVLGQIPLKITKNKIFGRGACDNKQSIAASIIVGNKLKDINLLFTVGEEKDFIGAKIAQRMSIAGDLVIVQEPTNFKIITSQRGVIGFAVKTKGRKEHSSVDNSDSAINKLIDILYLLKKNKWTSFNTGLIKGGIASNVVSDNAGATVSVRPKNLKEYKDILRKIKKIREIKIKEYYPPYISNLKFPKKISKHFTEMIFFRNSIQYGAGDILFAHGDKEHILRKDLNLIPQKLIELLNKIF